MDNSDIKSNLLLLSCAWCSMCKKENSFSRDNKVLTLIIAPLFVIARNMDEKYVLLRTYETTMI